MARNFVARAISEFAMSSLSQITIPSLSSDSNRYCSSPPLNIFRGTCPTVIPESFFAATAYLYQFRVRMTTVRLEQQSIFLHKHGIRGYKKGLPNASCRHVANVHLLARQIYLHEEFNYANGLARVIKCR